MACIDLIVHYEHVNIGQDTSSGDDWFSSSAAEEWRRSSSG
jgi:hypothetical protein